MYLSKRHIWKLKILCVLFLFITWPFMLKENNDECQIMVMLMQLARPILDRTDKNQKTHYGYFLLVIIVSMHMCLLAALKGYDSYHKMKKSHDVVLYCSNITCSRREHRWSSGRILACHAGGPGSIPGRCKLIFWCCHLFFLHQNKIGMTLCIHSYLIYIFSSRWLKKENFCEKNKDWCKNSRQNQNYLCSEIIIHDLNGWMVKVL